MRAQPDRITAGPAGAVGSPRRPGPALVIGIAAVVLCGLLVVVLVHLVDGRSGMRPDAAATVESTAPSEHVVTPPTPTPVPDDPDDAAVPTKASAQAAAGFVDAWLTKDRTRRLDQLKGLAVTSLYDGLTYTDPAEIPTAKRVGRPRVEDVGAYLVRYRVALSDQSEVLVSTVYDGSRWLVESVEPAVG